MASGITQPFYVVVKCKTNPSANTEYITAYPPGYNLSNSHIIGTKLYYTDNWVFNQDGRFVVGLKPDGINCYATDSTFVNRTVYVILMKL